MLKRSVWGLGDQAINSLSSLVLAVMVARASSPETVGAWAIGYAVYTFVLTVSRSAISTTALISGGADEGDADHLSIEFDREAVSAAVVAAAAVGLLLAPASLFLDGSLAFYILAFTLGLPLLIWHDALRFVTIRKGDLRITSAIDATWIVFQVVFGLIFLSISYDGRLVTLGWLAAAGVSLAVASFLVSPRVSIRRAFVFYKRHSRTISGLLLESSLGAGVANLQPAILGLVIGLASTGYFRGALSLLGVAGAVVMGLTPIVTVEAVKRIRDGVSLTSLLWIWVGCLGALGGVLTIAVSLLPEAVGTFLLGETWYGAAGIFPILAAQVIFRGPNTGVPIMLRAAHRIRLVVGVRFVHSIATLLITTLGAMMFGLAGAAWGWLFASAILSVFSILVYLRVVGNEKNSS